MNPGDLTRPSFPNRPGQGGNRPGIGGGNRPGLGGNRPGWNGGGNGWTGSIRPGQNGNRPGGWGGNGIGDNWGSGGWGGGNWSGNNINRPNNSNNWSNINNNWTNNNNYFDNSSVNNWFGGGGGGNTVINNGGWGGGGWGGGGWGGGGWGGGGWSSPVYNNGGWYQGGWNNADFGSSFVNGLGFGLGSSLTPYGGVFNSFPTWSGYGLSTWGLGSWANSWMYSGYANPYASAPVVVNVASGAQAQPAFNYTQPIDLTSVPPEPTIEEQASQSFEAARGTFKLGDAVAALGLIDRAIQQSPNDPSMHEFRALCLFALARYDEAAATLYTVLTAGPGWNWTTMIGLYRDSETYTQQLRSLEAKVNENTKAAGPRFVLAYQYMVQGHGEQAGTQFQELVNLQPQDHLSAEFARILTPVKPDVSPPPTATAAAPAPAPAAAPADQPRADVPEFGPPPTELVGTWKAEPAQGVSIQLTINDDQSFSWDVTTKGQTQSIAGQAGFTDGTLALAQEEGAPLAGKVEGIRADGFGFKILGGQNAPTLQFKKS